MRMSGRILQNREGGKCLREIIVDRENGAKACNQRIKEAKRTFEAEQQVIS